MLVHLNDIILMIHFAIKTFFVLFEHVRQKKKVLQHRSDGNLV